MAAGNQYPEYSPSHTSTAKLAPALTVAMTPTANPHQRPRPHFAFTTSASKEIPKATKGTTKIITSPNPSGLDAKIGVGLMVR